MWWRPSTSDHLPAQPGGEAERQLGLRRWRIFASVFLVYLGYALPDLFAQRPAVVAVGLGLMVAFVGLYLGPLPARAWGDRRAPAVRMLTAMAALMAVYLLVAGRGGLIFWTYLCVGIVVALPVRVSMTLLVGLTAAVVGLPQYVDSWHLVGQQWGTGVPGLLTGLAIYGARFNVRQQRELYQVREEVERLAADQERLRIARDLHDLLGHALTTVVVKSDLAGRLATLDAERAAAEMAEVAALARQALADVRSTVSGYRSVTLVGELASAREVLRAAGISAELPASTEVVPTEQQEFFGWALREAVTNAVRHSRARTLVVRLCGEDSGGLAGEVSLEVVDDGHGDSPGASSGSDAAGWGSAEWGSGLRGLHERVTAAGGRLTAAPLIGGGFRVCVVVPLALPSATGRRHPRGQEPPVPVSAA